MGDLADGVLVVLHVDDDLDRVEDAVVDDGVDADGDVVAGDAFLGGDRHGDDLHVDLVQAVGDRRDEGQPGRPGARAELAEAQHDAAFELGDDPDAGPGQQQDQRPRSRSATNIMVISSSVWPGTCSIVAGGSRR